MSKERDVDPIPGEFDSYENAAEFWDTHDTTGYLDAFHTVEVDCEFRDRRYEAQLARFWDTHDLTDFEYQLEEITAPVFQRETDTFAVPLEPQEIQAVRRIAGSQGVDYVALIQGWALEIHYS